MKSRTQYGNWGKTTSSNFRKTTGKLYKGSTQTGPNKTMTSSIPSKYETVIFKFENKKAFGASSVRFQMNANENPGPGAFKRSRDIKPARDTQSYSKKGYTNGFASTAQRQLQQIRYVNTGPGPGQYDHRRFNQTTKKGLFLQSEKSTAQSDKKSKTGEFWDQVPGPGHYNPKLLMKKQENRAGFKSRTLRNFMKLQLNPPPNRYRISRALIKKKPFKHKGGTSVFAKPTKKRKRDMIEGFLKYRKIKKNKDTPGPGHYHMDEPYKDSLFPIDERNQKLTCQFKTGAVDRFGDYIGKPLKNKKGKPGPGAYFKEEKLPDQVIVSGCMFMSETDRQPFGAVIQNLGPGHYNYEKPSKKKTHLVKFKERWI